jgi:hypothetical protein
MLGAREIPILMKNRFRRTVQALSLIALLLGLLLVPLACTHDRGAAGEGSSQGPASLLPIVTPPDLVTCSDFEHEECPMQFHLHETLGRPGCLNRICYLPADRVITEQVCYYNCPARHCG